MTPRNRQKVVLEKTGLAAYTAAAAAAAAIGMPSTAQASIHYSGPQNLAVNDITPQPGGGVGFILPFGAASSYHLVVAHQLNTPGVGVGFFGNFSNPAPVSVAGFAAGAWNYALNLPYSTPISGLASFLPNTAIGTLAAGPGYTNSQFTLPGIGMMALKFNTNQYGWIRVNMGGTSLNSFTIVDWAWGDAGTPVGVGHMPEPATLGLLAMGAAGLAKWRRRRVAA